MLDWQSLVGKTIQTVDNTSAINVVNLTFTDGTKVCVDTERVMAVGIYAPVLYAVTVEPTTPDRGNREMWKV